MGLLHGLPNTLVVQAFKHLPWLTSRWAKRHRFVEGREMLPELTLAMTNPNNIIALDDKDLKTTDNYWQRFTVAATRKFHFLVNSKPAREGAWEVDHDVKRTITSAVATVLEQQFSTIAGVDSMTSTSGTGNTQITLQFALERNIDAAAQDVQSMIARAQRQLPPGMPSPPSYQKVNPADTPVLFLTLSSPTLPFYTVDEYAQTFLAQRISSINSISALCEATVELESATAKRYSMSSRSGTPQASARRAATDSSARSSSGIRISAESSRFTLRAESSKKTSAMPEACASSRNGPSVARPSSSTDSSKARVTTRAPVRVPRPGRRRRRARRERAGPCAPGAGGL